MIHVYVASAVDIEESNFKKECLDWKGSGAKDWDKTKLRDKDFICYIDRERTKDVWGETFETLLAIMKNLRFDKGQKSGSGSVPSSKGINLMINEMK